VTPKDQESRALGPNPNRGDNFITFFYSDRMLLLLPSSSRSLGDTVIEFDVSFFYIFYFEYSVIIDDFHTNELCCYKTQRYPFNPQWTVFGHLVVIRHHTHKGLRGQSIVQLKLQQSSANDIVPKGYFNYLLPSQYQSQPHNTNTISSNQ
jgi:hypothetical protein